MRQRCMNPSSASFHHYGGRGIKICERWDTYANFLADMGERPDGLSLDRIDNDGDYTPLNCRWATKTQQMRNQSVTRRVTIGGVTYVAKDLADTIGVKTDTIVERAQTCTTLDEVLDPAKRVYHAGLALGGIANGQRQRNRTHCKRGHEFTVANTAITPTGWRRCRRCKADAEGRRRLARKT